MQRDLYSAFLLMCSDIDLEKPNRDLCLESFKNFMENHDNCINEFLENKSNTHILSSFGLEDFVA